MYVCMHACMYVCMYVYVYGYVCADVYVYLYAYIVHAENAYNYHRHQQFVIDASMLLLLSFSLWFLVLLVFLLLFLA